jgi:oxygen-independent coproporphyrinogen-3 oxidase
LANITEKLTEFERDELIQIQHNTLSITKKGKPFVRNICMAFDVLLQRKKPETQLFSMTI